MFDIGHKRTSMLTAAPPGIGDAIALGVSGPSGGASRARRFDNISGRREITELEQLAEINAVVDQRSTRVIADEGIRPGDQARMATAYPCCERFCCCAVDCISAQSARAIADAI